MHRVRSALPFCHGIEPEGGSWRAEDECLDCLLKYPNGYACHFPLSTMPAS